MAGGVACCSGRARLSADRESGALRGGIRTPQLAETSIHRQRSINNGAERLTPEPEESVLAVTAMSTEQPAPAQRRVVYKKQLKFSDVFFVGSSNTSMFM